MLDEEVSDRRGLATVRWKGNKSRRAMRRDRVAQEGKKWTAAVIMTVGKMHDGYWTSDRM